MILIILLFIYYKNVRSTKLIDSICLKRKFNTEYKGIYGIANGSSLLIYKTLTRQKGIGVFVSIFPSENLIYQIFSLQNTHRLLSGIMLIQATSNTFRNINQWFKDELGIYSNYNLSDLLNDRKPYLIIIQNFDLLQYDEQHIETFTRALATESANHGNFIVLLCVNSENIGNKILKYNQGEKIQKI